MARVRALLLVKYQYDALLQQTADMERIATTDALTGTRNRLYLLEEGQRFLTSLPNGWVMIIDLDHFKHINDTKGHLMGDQVLMAIGKLLNLRFSDSLSARFGGEEFVVVAHGDETPVRAEDLRLAVEEFDPAGIEVTISIGLACMDDHPGDDLNTLLGHADKALYAAKDAGRNQAYVNKGDMIKSLALEIRF